MSALCSLRLYPLFRFSKHRNNPILQMFQLTTHIRTRSVFHSIYIAALPPLFTHRDSLRHSHHEAGC